MESILRWLAGDGQYHTLVHCMGRDWIVIGLVAFLCAATMIGYWLIARHWRDCEVLLDDDSPTRRVLSQLRWVFVLCSFCGYMFVLIKLVWPAWRLYLVPLALLTWYTWRFAIWGVRGMIVIYEKDRKIFDILARTDDALTSSKTLEELRQRVNDLQRDTRHLVEVAKRKNEQGGS